MAKTGSSSSGVWDQDLPLVGGDGQKRTPVQNVKQTTKAKVVRDDWDDDDDDDDNGEGVGDTHKGEVRDTPSGDYTTTSPAPMVPGPTHPRERDPEDPEKGAEESNKIWVEANKHAPMPELIVAPASTGQSALPPPPAAFQPTLRILKRPSPNIGGTPVGTLSSASSPSSGPISTPGSGATSPTPRGTLAEREAQYQEARSRIFGERERGLGGASSGSVSRTSSSLGGVHVVRDPLGPPPTGSATGSEPEPDRPAKGFGERRRGKMKNEMK